MTEKSGSTSSGGKRHQRRDDKGRFTDSRGGRATAPERKREDEAPARRDDRDRDDQRR